MKILKVSCPYNLKFKKGEMDQPSGTVIRAGKLQKNKV